jgi:hypothetical protein
LPAQRLILQEIVHEMVMTQETLAKNINFPKDEVYSSFSEHAPRMEIFAYQQEHDWKITSKISWTARMVYTWKRGKTVIILQLLQSNVNV